MLFPQRIFRTRKRKSKSKSSNFESKSSDGSSGSAGQAAPRISSSSAWTNTTATSTTSTNSSGPTSLSENKVKLAKFIIPPLVRRATMRIMESPETAMVREREAAIKAGVIYGTRTYDWGSGGNQAKNKVTVQVRTSRTQSTFRGLLSIVSGRPKQEDTMLDQQLTEIHPTHAASKFRNPDLAQREYPAIESAVEKFFASSQESARGLSVAFSDKPSRTSQVSQASHISHGAISRAPTNATRQSSTTSRRRFSFEDSSSNAGTMTTESLLFRNDSDASQVTHISMSGDPTPGYPHQLDVVGSDVDLPSDDESPSDRPSLDGYANGYANGYSGALKLYSSPDELAELTAFEFTDDFAVDDMNDFYDDGLLEEVNAVGANVDDLILDESPYTTTRLSNQQTNVSNNPSLSPISERYDDDYDEPMREVVAYVRKHSGWVVERRRRRTNQSLDGLETDAESKYGKDVLIGTERVKTGRI
ncbi:uncharacterized protein V1516DRAFT_668925 [Lipomyces oligophaga]|uniref:uncharacterized protein n=1 Tax=Lipomyces oligophaga TaxID=45792 RepID=UPI0034CDD72D